MSLAEQRAALVTALEKVPQLSVAVTQPDNITAGSAWPAWDRAQPTNACVTAADWFVFVCVPGGDAQSRAAAGDQLVDDVLPVLTLVGKVTAVESWRIPVEPGQQAVPVQRYTMEI